jgi:hypothetical protein
MPHAANFVHDHEDGRAAGGIHDVLEAVLMLVAFLFDQRSFVELAMRPREIRHVNLHVMAVVVGNRLVGFPENEFPTDSTWNPRESRARFLVDRRRNAHEVAIEVRDRVGSLPGTSNSM